MFRFQVNNQKQKIILSIIIIIDLDLNQKLNQCLLHYHYMIYLIYYNNLNGIRSF